jgi:hypothetical protein
MVGVSGGNYKKRGRERREEKEKKGEKREGRERERNDGTLCIVLVHFAVPGSTACSILDTGSTTHEGEFLKTFLWTTLQKVQ